MKLSENDVLHLATLSRLSLSEQEKKVFPDQLDSILDFVKTVNEADVSETIVRDMNNLNTMREDVVTSENNVEERSAVIEGMPQEKENYLSVPKIL